MKAMVIEKIVDVLQEDPLKVVEMPEPTLQEGQLLIKINACGVCRTDLDEIEGRTAPSFYPVIPGHQVIGTIVEVKNPSKFKTGDRVGVGWIFKSCGKCSYCIEGHENLCDVFQATGRDAHGGYAEYMAAYEDFIYKIPDIFSDIEAAPLLCAGAIGWRSLRLTGAKQSGAIGLFGFGASGHIVIQIAKCLYRETKIFVFTRSEKEQALALQLGANWAGQITEQPPELLDVAIDTTPAWLPVISALKNLKKGGRLVINAIRKENKDIDIMKEIKYETHLWMEKEIKSVANVGRRDIAEFLEIAANIPIKPQITTYSLDEANQALKDLKTGTKAGAKVLVMD
ncbi:MAG TPA: zinc-dependent alcohol dehydrogenase family protein [bacterium]|mgnify:FL=1|nr:zinc-dependent alcohol dehydrogenase family protein [bacterium]HOL49216.1 zinc-dependent alcohol dehydrogenase family protein [bacterium]